MKAEWVCFKEHIAPESCREIIDLALTYNAGRGTLGDEGVLDTKIRSSEVRWFHRWDVYWSELFETIDACVEDANRNCFGVDYEPVKSLQFSAYDGRTGDHYERHQDLYWGSSHPCDRKLTVLLQLSDPEDYEGGAFELTDCERTPPAQDVRAQGTVLVFPSFVFHVARPVTAGIRYSVVGWYEGPPWR